MGASLAWTCNQSSTWGRRTFNELTFQVASFMVWVSVKAGAKVLDHR